MIKFQDLKERLAFRKAVKKQVRDLTFIYESSTGYSDAAESYNIFKDTVLVRQGQLGYVSGYKTQSRASFIIRRETVANANKKRQDEINGQ